MKSPHILNLGNPRKVKDNLSAILDQRALDALEAEIAANSAALFKLGRQHYQFAVKQTVPNWRQKVSRLYYAAYNVSRAVRLFVAGEYSTDVKDHQRFERLPDDFPSKDRFVNQLTVLREDRNACDYDHTFRASNLVLGTSQSSSLVSEFLEQARNYLQGKGLNI